MTAGQISYYFERFGYGPAQIAEPPHPDLGLIVVIPCFNETAILECLDSLSVCQRPLAAVEVIVAVNSPIQAPPCVLAQNEQTLGQIRQWQQAHPDARFRVHALHFPGLPRKHAGVGLARKIGMDEAIRRFARFDPPVDGVIACFDADCRCDPTYLIAIEEHFSGQPRPPACAIYFEHPLDGPFPEEVYRAAGAYELHLRYYVQALRHAGFPYAFHTLGSCMAVRAGAYILQGGMNRRQAGEDFYFLHKMIPLGGFTELNSTRVIPSPRSSDRVPFGTGKAVRAVLAGEEVRTYPLQAFLDLREFFDRQPELGRPNESLAPLLTDLPKTVQSFLTGNGFVERLAELRKNTSGAGAFAKRFFGWFNAFFAMKFIHHARDHFYGAAPLEREAADLLSLYDQAPRAVRPNVLCLLGKYRRLNQVENWRSPGHGRFTPLPGPLPTRSS